jgi:hypothetical protein
MALRICVVMAAVLASSAFAAGTPHIIHGDTSVGGLILGRTTPPRAAMLFAGDGARRATRRSNACRVSWPRIGLMVDFATIGSDPANPCTGGAAVIATVTSRPAWRTAVGLRVGDGTTRLARLYPHARRHADGYWLLPRRACEVTGGYPYAGLLARVRGGRVSALVATTAICD